LLDYGATLLWFSGPPARLGSSSREASIMRLSRRKFVHSTFALAAAPLVPVGYSRADDTTVRATAGDLAARTTGGRTMSLTRGDILDLRASLRGELILAADAGYDQARRLWNAAFDRRPALIARCAGAADVVRAVQFARSHGLLTAVRGGGHSYTGESGCDDGLVIDLSGIKGLRVDPKHRTAEAQPGVRLGEFDRETQAFGLATTLGTAPDTGIAGLTLGGGFGRLDRQFGLACDNLRAVDIVTADGTLRHADQEENRDLFWGVRGGGGNFGVVTNFEYGLHPVGPTVLAGSRIFPFARAREVMTAVLDFAQTIPDEMYVFAFVARDKGGSSPELMVGYEVFYSGALGEGERLLEPLKKLGKALLDTVAPKPYVSAQQAYGDWEGPENVRSEYSKTGFMERVSTSLIDEIVRRFEAAPTIIDLVVVFREGGAFGRVKPDATAFWNRWCQYAMTLSASWAGRSQNDQNLKAAREVWSTLAPYTRNFYINVDTERGERQVRANYGDNYSRLVEIKTKYDPTNLFRLNGNIRPRTEETSPRSEG